MRYVTKQGSNRYISLKRRAGRFLFVTIRDAQTPVTIRRIGHLANIRMPIGLYLFQHLFFGGATLMSEETRPVVGGNQDPIVLLRPVPLNGIHFLLTKRNQLEVSYIVVPEKGIIWLADDGRGD